MPHGHVIPRLHIAQPFGVGDRTAGLLHADLLVPQENQAWNKIGIALQQRLVPIKRLVVLSGEGQGAAHHQGHGDRPRVIRQTGLCGRKDGRGGMGPLHRFPEVRHAPPERGGRICGQALHGAVDRVRQAAKRRQDLHLRFVGQPCRRPLDNFPQGFNRLSPPPFPVLGHCQFYSVVGHIRYRQMQELPDIQRL